MKSKITGGETTLIFTKRLLNKYDVKYYRCNDTGFIQTEDPFWLEEAYSSAITKLDVGLVSRNIFLAERVSKLLMLYFNRDGQFLDYAGGYGLFTRLMRDRGFHFYNTDKYCANLFAENFSLEDVPPGTKFELTTAFEVFEHLPNPVEEIKGMLKFSDNLLFSTELQPENIADVENWSYLSHETGQHVAFYTVDALKNIAGQLGYHFYTDGKFLHLFSKQKFAGDVLIPGRDPFLVRKAKKFIKKFELKKYGKTDGLLMKDWQYIKDKLNG